MDEEKSKVGSDLVDAEELEFEREEQPVAQFDKAQRDLVVQALDFNLSTLADMVAKDVIDTSPTYQRRARWNVQRSSRLIESFLMNVPVPPIFLAEDDYGKYSVIDGQQRLRAIHDYFTNQYHLSGLAVFPELNGRTLSELPREMQHILTVRPSLRCIIILKQSSPEIKFDVFVRLNTGGVSLNAQEIRNSAFRGPMNDLVHRLSWNSDFRRLLKIKNPDESAIVRHMRDCELVLRFFALRDTWDRFSGSMNETLNRYMAENRRPADDQMAGLEHVFLTTLRAVEAAFGEHAFVRWDPRRRAWTRAPVAALFDAEMLACIGLDPDDLNARQETIVYRLQRAFEDEDFASAVIGGTNQPTKLVLRVRRVEGIIRSSILK